MTILEEEEKIQGNKKIIMLTFFYINYMWPLYRKWLDSAGGRGPYLKMVSVQDDLGVALEVRKVYQVCTCTFLHLFPKKIIKLI